MGHKEELNLLSDLSYFGVTTAVGQQTLGEEYCDIIQIENRRTLPLVAEERIFLILFHVLIPYSLNKLNSWASSLQRTEGIENHPSNAPNPGILTEQRRRLLAKVIPRAISFLAILKRVHVALFFFSGEFYHLSKRLLNIRYVRFLLLTVRIMPTFLSDRFSHNLN
jgi:peroxin-10